MEPVPANVKSPLAVEMLRTYAEHKKSLENDTPQLFSLSASPINFPKAIIKKRSVKASLRDAGSNIMDILFGATPTTANNTSDD